MNAMSRKEADACVEETLAYDDASGRIRVRNGKLSGLLLIEARDPKEAIQVAAKMPMARRGSIEVRRSRSFAREENAMKFVVMIYHDENVLDAMPEKEVQPLVHSAIQYAE